MPYIVLFIYLLLSLALQVLTGNFPVGIMAFPLNLICSLLWFAGMYMLWTKCRKSLFVRYMLSPGATFMAIFLFVDACIVIGLTGERSMTSSWIFIAILLYFQTVLFFVLMRGLREQSPTGARVGPIRWRFIFNHAGLLLALAAGFWGDPDSQTLRLRAYENQPVTQAILPGVGPVGIENELILRKFTLERYENGVPSLYEAQMQIDGKEVSLRVNHPYRLGFGRNLYLTGYDKSAQGEAACCIMQIIYEPWKYWAFAGIILMLTGAMLLFIQGPRRYKPDTSL